MFGGISFLGAIFIILFVLKITGQSHMSWLLVFAPVLWPAYAVIGGIMLWLLAIMMVGFLVWISDSLKRAWRRIRRIFK